MENVTLKYVCAKTKWVSHEKHKIHWKHVNVVIINISTTDNSVSFYKLEKPGRNSFFSVK